jgi:hypothetical protein
MKNIRLMSLLVMGILFMPITYVMPVNAQDGRRVLAAPQGNGRVRPERRRRHGIKHSFARAGKSAGHGGKRFGQNMAQGRPVRAGKHFGKGMGGFGKHFGIGMAKTVKRTVTP